MKNKPIKYGSVCSGVEAATVAWHQLGWEPQWFCEFDKFPSEVLEHRYPDIPNLHDMLEIEKRDEFNDRTIDLLVGGTPCQSFSIAGLRQGLDDERGNLALKYCEILDLKRPRWFVWENAPGVLSSNGGSDLQSIFAGFRECGYQFAYRILDAQYFGVPQRRRRIFVVGYLGDWRPPATVLFERESLFRHNPKGPPQKQNPSTPVEESIVIDRAAFNQGTNAQYEPKIEKSSTAPSLVARGPHAVAHRMRGFGDYETDNIASPVKARDFKDSTDLISVHCFKERGGCEGGGKGYMGQDEKTYTLSTMQDQNILYENHPADSRITPVEQSPTINSRAVTGGGNLPYVQNQLKVRKLTPKECERLQGFPDEWTKIPYRGKEAEKCPDGPRYKAMGNSMAVPVMHWIGQRIQMVENTLLEVNNG